MPDLDAALTEAEVELVRRTRLLEAEDAPNFAAYRQGGGELLPALVVVASEAQRHGVRIRAVCGLGRRLGLGTILYGSAEGCGASVQVDEAGTTNDVAPATLATELANARLYRLAAQEADEVLCVLAAAREEAPESTKTAAVDHAELERLEDVRDNTLASVPIVGSQVKVRLLGPYRIAVNGRRSARGSAAAPASSWLTTCFAHGVPV